MKKIFSNNSIKSKIIKRLIKFSKFKKNTSSIENVKRYINWCSKRKITSKIFNGMEKLKYKDYTYYKNENTESDALLFYIHGGSFVDKPLYIQVKFAKKVAKKLNASLAIPLYKTIPIGNAENFLEEMCELYSLFLNKYKKIYLMGDSAGGGAVLSLSLLLKDKNIKIPDALIMLSPWLDVSLENKELNDKDDIVCSIVGNKYCGSIWAGKYNINDYRVSPINGNFIGLNKIFVVCSKKELCYPDCIKFVNKLEESNYEFIQFDNQFHNFELYPMKESEIVINEIYKYIIGDE